MALKRPCDTCPFTKKNQSELSFDSVMQIEYNIRAKQGYVVCSEDSINLCVGSHSVALKDDIAKESAIYRFQEKKIGPKATKALKALKSTYRGFEEFADHQYDLEQHDG